MNPKTMYPPLVRFLALLCFLFLSACTEKNPETQHTVINQKLALTSITQKQLENTGNVANSKTADSIQAILATTDLSIGKQRVGFILVSRLGKVSIPQVTVTSQALSGDQSLSQTTEAQFKPWASKNRGLYVAKMNFPQQGDWQLNISIAWPDGTTKFSNVLVEIKEQSIVPMVGSLAIKSITKTILDSNNISELTSGTLQDPDFYQLTLAEAAENGRPTIVVFTSPAFCSGPFCGPQLEILRDIKLRYKKQVDFIHVDYYQNPHLIFGNLDNAVISKAALEWHLPDTQWTFIIDHNGTITHRYQGFVNFEELNQSLEQTFRSTISSS